MMTKSFDHYYDHYTSHMSDIQLHNDFRKVLDWVKDKPGHVTSFSELASVISGQETPDDDANRTAVGVTVMLTTWPEALGEICFEVVAEDGAIYPVTNLTQEMIEGEAPYVIRETGEVVEDFPSRAIPRIRIADFEPAIESAFKA
jgi:hypothetical protein